MVSVLFVCMGNICRSPMAEGVFRTRVEVAGLCDSFNIDSAGTIGYHAGNPPDGRGTATMAAKGLDISMQRSRKVTRQDFDAFDYIIVMDEDNRSDLMARSPQEQQHKIQLFLGYSDQHEYHEVPDPYYGGDHGFELVYDLVDGAAGGLLSHIRKQHF